VPKVDGSRILNQEQHNIHEMIQAYLNGVYASFDHDIKKTLHYTGNEIYGEVLYYSTIKLIKHLKIKPEDHFLDIGSGLGKLAFYIYFGSQAASVSGIEINSARHAIATQAKELVQKQLPRMFENRELLLIDGDFLQQSFDKTTIVYICSTIFSYELLEKIGSKLNDMPNLQRIASFRKLPFLSNFNCIKKLLIHCSWERVGCYIYERKGHEQL
jgi:SAM-dependent methyltransferase